MDLASHFAVYAMAVTAAWCLQDPQATNQTGTVDNNALNTTNESVSSVNHVEIHLYNATTDVIDTVTLATTDDDVHANTTGTYHAPKHIQLTRLSWDKM